MRKQRYSVMPWEKLGLQRRYMFRKGKSAVENDPKKSWNGIETEEVRLEVSLVGIH